MIESFYQLNTPISLALVTDLHGRPYESVIESLYRNSPEAICICGDFIYGRSPENERSPLETQPNVLPFMKACAEISPTFVALGNHEWMLDAADLGEIERAGVKVLDNDWIEWNGIVIGGLTSAEVENYRRFKEEYSGNERYPHRELIRERFLNLSPNADWINQMPSGYRIMLSHHPEYWDLVKGKGIDLMLSGHTHNGQIAYYSFRKHRWTGLWAPGQGLFPKYSSGVYESGSLVVSAGLSNTAPVPRLFNPTQIVYIDGKKGQGL